MFREIRIKELKESPVELFDSRWGLLSAGTEEKYNMMTISWGMLGELWGKEVCTVFVRPQRYTYKFTENGSHFTVSFFPKSMKKALSLCGTKSGRNIDKAKEAGLSPHFCGKYLVYDEAEIVICCKKLYAQKIDAECFTEKDIDKEIYSQKDYHTVYVCEIEKVLMNN